MYTLGSVGETYEEAFAKRPSTTADGALLDALNQKPVNSDSLKFLAALKKNQSDQHALAVIKYLKEFDFGADKDELILKLFKSESLNTNLKLKLFKAEALVTDLKARLNSIETPTSVVLI